MVAGGDVMGPFRELSAPMKSRRLGHHNLKPTQLSPFSCLSEFPCLQLLSMQGILNERGKKGIIWEFLV